MNTQRPASAYYPQSVGNLPRPTNLHQSIPNLKSPPAVHRLQNEDSRSGSYPSVNSRNDERTPHPNYQGQRLSNEESKHQHYAGTVMSSQYGQPTNYQSPMQNQSYSPSSPHHIPNGQRGHDELMRQPSNDMRYQQNLMRDDVFRQSQQGRLEDVRMNSNGNQMRNEEIMRYNSNNIKSDNQSRVNEELRQQGKLISNEDIIRSSEVVKTGDVMRTSKSEDMIRQHVRDEMMKYNSTNNIRTQEDLKSDERNYNQKQIDDVRQSNIARPEEIVRQAPKNPDEIVRQHPVNASLRGQAKMVEMSEEVRRRQNRVGYNQHPPNTSSYQQYQPPNNYYQQAQSQNQAYQQQYYQTPPYTQQYQQQMSPMSPVYIQSPNAYSHHTPTSTMNARNYPNTPNQTPMAQAQSAMQNLSLNTSYPSNVTSPGYGQNNYNYSGPMSPQGSYKLPPTAPKPGRKAEDVPPELPPTSTHPLYSASMQEPPKGAFYPNPPVQGKVGPANPWEREEREKVNVFSFPFKKQVHC